jgi:hypothetical protein
MKSIKQYLAAFTMMAVLSVGTAFAQSQDRDGIIIAGLNDTADCTEKSESGIIIAGLAGIIIAGFTGIIIAGATEENPNETCGIIIAG